MQATMAKSADRPTINTRVDERTLQRINALAEEMDVDRSVVIRTLLATALGDPKHTVVAREIVMILSGVKKQIIANFHYRVQSVVTEMREEAERSARENA